MRTLLKRILEWKAIKAIFRMGRRRGRADMRYPRY
jgi:hypothetical protein